jgi:starch synthase
VNVLFVSAECAPFAKTGGLGDVSAALPRYLGKRGHDVRVVLPLYARVREKFHGFRPVLEDLSVQLGPTRVIFSVVEGTLPGSRVPVYFVHCPALYDRKSIYTSDPDEHLRFSVLQWAALKICQFLRFAPDVVHANDWQTALLPLMLRTVFQWDKLFQKTRTVLTLHNVGHQGTFGAHVLPETGLSEASQHFHQEQLGEGRINFLLTGLLFADVITTVSPTYAREIQTPEHGVGLDGFLRARKDVLFGILNGIDEDVWSPERDPLIPARFSASDLSGKERCKHALTQKLRLPYHPRAPIFGIVSRLAWQKGFDLLSDVLPHVLARHDAQVVVLGQGEGKYEELFSRLARQMPHKVAFHRGFSEPLAHLIEAGSDFFLMPSRYEPCGLNQMYSLRYGTPPIVHKTGGLADTVRLWKGPGSGGNGIVFEHFDAKALLWAMEYALEVWGSGTGEDRARFRELQRNGMSDELGWDRRVGQYDDLYRQLTGIR